MNSTISVETVLPDLLAILDDKSKTVHLAAELQKRPHTDQCVVILLGITDRDCLFYHFFLCSLLQSTSRLPIIVVLLDDLTNPRRDLNIICDRQIYLSDIQDRMARRFGDQAIQPFFYRVAAPLVLKELNIDFGQVIVADNDILLLGDLNGLASGHCACRYVGQGWMAETIVRLNRRWPPSHQQGTRVPPWATWISEGFLEARKGPYGDFFFALKNTPGIIQIVEDAILEPLPASLPASFYTRHWLTWLRILNQLPVDEVVWLDQVPNNYNDDGTYQCKGVPQLYHVGGGYGRRKVDILLAEARKHRGILDRSPLANIIAC